MYNAKPIIATALGADGNLIALIPKVRMFEGVALFVGEPQYPYLTYEELDNHEGLHADDDEIESEVTFRIHLWGKTTSLSTLAGHVNRIMQALDFGRNYSQDQDEVLETGEIIKHKIMSFSNTFMA